MKKLLLAFYLLKYIFHYIPQLLFLKTLTFVIQQVFHLLIFFIKFLDLNYLHTLIILL